MRQNIKCANIFHMNTDVFAVRTRERNCHGDEEQVFCSKTESSAGGALKGSRGRSSFYKYKDDIFPFYDNAKGKTVTFVTQMDDEPGLLSDLLHIVAVYKANILTIHQSIPVNGVATLTLSVEVLSDTGDVSNMVEEIEMMKGIHYVKILARE